MDLKCLVLQKSLLYLDPCNFEPQITMEKYTTPIHLDEHLTTFLSMEIIVCNYAFFEDRQSIFHALPPFMVETTYALHVFLLCSKFVCPTLDFNMGFL